MGGVRPGRSARLAGQPADRLPDLPHFTVSDDRVVGTGPHLLLQRRLSAAAGQQAPGPGQAGRDRVDGDLGHHRPHAGLGDDQRRRHLVGRPAAADGPARLLGRDLLDLLLQPGARRRGRGARGVHRGQRHHRTGHRRAAAGGPAGPRVTGRPGPQRGRGQPAGRPGAGRGGRRPVRRRLPAPAGYRRAGAGRHQRARGATGPARRRARRLARGRRPAHRPAGHRDRRGGPVRGPAVRWLGDLAGRGHGAAAARRARQPAGGGDGAGGPGRAGPGRRLPVVPGPGRPADQRAGQRGRGLPGPAAASRGPGRPGPGQDHLLLQHQPRVPHPAHPDHGPAGGAPRPGAGHR